MSELLLLPDEIIIKIMTMLSNNELLNLSLTNRKIFRLYQGRYLWNNKISFIFPKINPSNIYFCLTHIKKDFLHNFEHINVPSVLYELTNNLDLVNINKLPLDCVIYYRHNIDPYFIMLPNISIRKYNYLNNNKYYILKRNSGDDEALLKWNPLTNNINSNIDIVDDKSIFTILETYKNNGFMVLKNNKLNKFKMDLLLSLGLVNLTQ